MLASFPAPVLSVAADAVRELEGRDALSGLWTLFTKCKESIQDGHRLENISWRLWYRDLMLSSQVVRLEEPFHDEKHLSFSSALDDALYRPLTPLEPMDPSTAFHSIDVNLQSMTDSEVHPLLSRTSSVPVVKRRPLSVRTQSGSILTGSTSMSVGKFICDILPSSNFPLLSPPNGRALGGTLSLPSMPSTFPEAEATRFPRIQMKLSSTSKLDSTFEDEAPASSALLPHLHIPEPTVKGEEFAAPGTLRLTPETEENETSPYQSTSHSPSKSPVPAQLLTLSLALPPPPASDQSSCSPLIAISSSPSASTASTAPVQSGSSSSPRSSLLPASSESILASSSQSSASLVIPQVVTCPTVYGPPSPSLSDSYARAHPNEVTDPTCSILNQTQTQNLTASLSSDRYGASRPPLIGVSTPNPDLAQFATPPPMLVVVNPTPGPTPHPTPPTTPLLMEDIGKRVHGQYLTPPGNNVTTPYLLPLPPLILGTDTREGRETYEQPRENSESGQSSDGWIGVGTTVGYVFGESKLEGQDNNRSRSVLNEEEANVPAGSAVVSGVYHLLSSPNLSEVQPTTESSLPQPHQVLPLQRSQNSQQYHQHQQRFQHQRQPHPNQPSNSRQKQHQHRLSFSSTASSSHASSSQVSVVATSATGTIDEPIGPTRTKDGLQAGVVLPWAVAMTSAIPPSHPPYPHPPPPPIPAPAHTLSSPSVNSSTFGQERSSSVAPSDATSPVSPSPSAETGPSSVASADASRSPASPTSPEAYNNKAATGGLTRRASSGASVGGSSSRSRNAGSSSRSSSGLALTKTKTKSRSRSREAGNSAGLMAAMMGMTTANHGPTRKAGARSGAKSRVVHGRTASGRGRGSGVTGAALARTLSHEDVEEQEEEGEEEEDEVEECDGAEEKPVERVGRENEKAVALALAAEKARERQREVEREETRQLEKKREQEKLRELALREQEFEKESERMRQQREKDAGGLKKPVKFNIGSNSDEGSGIGSKSAGSGSDMSGRNPGSLVQKIGALMASRGEGAVNGKGKEREQEIDHQPQSHFPQREAVVEIEKDGQGGVKAEGDKERQKEKERKERKEKERKEKERKEKERKEAEAQALAKAKESLAAPLLPQAQRRTIVLATSESDFTDTEDESWTSGEITEDDVEVTRPQHTRQLSHPELRQQLQPLQQLPPAPTRPAPLQRTQSNTIGNRSRQQILRAQQQRREAQANVEKATAELQRQQARQREMFAKLPTSSFQNLMDGASRTRSVGLLTQLLNPDPTIFPVTHPYRRGYSSSEIPNSIVSQMNGRAGPSIPRPQPPPPPPPQQQQPLLPPPPPSPPPKPPVQREQPPTRPPTRPPSPRQRRTAANAVPPRLMRGGSGLQMSKSSAAGPVSSHFQVGSVHGKGAAVPPKVAPPVVHTNGMGSGGYRPRGPPQGQELEDDSDSEDDVHSSIQVSKSVAHEKLKALAERGGIVAHMNRIPSGDTGLAGVPGDGDEGEVPIWARGHQNAPGRVPRALSNPLQQSQNHHRGPVTNGYLQGQHYTPNPAPIPLGHPYNLPAPALPSTPRTTRRVMLQAEMSESLRRNLLWERQVSMVNLAGVRRSSSGGGSRNNVLGGLMPLTTTPSMVQLHAKGTKPENNDNSGRGTGERERRASGGRKTPTETEDRKRKAMARNRSWADDYHTSGW